MPLGCGVVRSPLIVLIRVCSRVLVIRRHEGVAAAALATREKWLEKRVSRPVSSIWNAAWERRSASTASLYPYDTRAPQEVRG